MKKGEGVSDDCICLLPVVVAEVVEVVEVVVVAVVK